MTTIDTNVIAAALADVHANVAGVNDAAIDRIVDVVVQHVSEADPSFDGDAFCGLVFGVEQPLTRERAISVLVEREGTPYEHVEHLSTEQIVAAALAPAGQPCADCGELVVYSDELGDWQHLKTPTGCFLARGDER